VSGPSIVSRLAGFLRWTDGELVSTVQAIGLDVVTAELGAAVGELSQAEHARGSAILEAVQELPDGALARFLTAPEVYFRLSHGGDSAGNLIAFLVDCLDAERRVAGLEAAQSKAVWTGVGDWYFPAAATSVDLRPDADPLRWTADAVHRAPRLANGVPVDFDSPFRTGRLPDVSGDDAELSRAERVVIIERLERAVASLGDASPGAARMVTQLSRVIVPRKDHGPDRQYRSTSTRICPGRPVLRNADLPEATTEELIDGLVHETIHCVIDLLELREPLVPDRQVRASMVVASPWTQRDLDIDTYLHACFVWYGLWNLWMQALDAPSLDPRSVLRYLELCAHGFVSADVAGPLRDSAAALAPSLLTVLDEMQARVRDEVALIERALAHDAP
jgi:hypothetical protein